MFGLFSYLGMALGGVHLLLVRTQHYTKAGIVSYTHTYIHTFYSYILGIATGGIKSDQWNIGLVSNHHY